MKLLFDLFPVILFFLVYKFYTNIPADIIVGINGLFFLSLIPGESSHAFYLATLVAVVASFLQVSGFWLKYQRVEKMHLISLILIAVFGGLTLSLNDPLFFKWKPTIINWLFAAVFFGSQFIGRSPIVKRMMGHAVKLADSVWLKLNVTWVVFFATMGIINLFVAYNFSEETWVEFKLFGLMGMTLIFVLVQGVYIARHMQDEP